MAGIEELARRAGNASAMLKAGNTGTGEGAKSSLPSSPTVEKQEEKQKDDKNTGGFIGGLGYLSEKVATSFVSSIEGISDYALGGLAELFGADDWAEKIMETDWLGDWYTHPDRWYKPSKGWQVAGDVASGIGTSLPAIGSVVAAGAIAGASGGTLAPAAAGLISAGVAGASAAGRSVSEAYKETGELGAKEWGYGTLSGIVEGGTEGLTNALSLGGAAVIKSAAGAFGKSTAKAAAKSVASSAARSAVAGTLGETAKSLGKAFAGEAFEEGISEVIDPYLRRATIDENAKNATAGEVAYAALIGGLSGMLMDGGNMVWNTAASYRRGNKLVNGGGADSILEISRGISDYERSAATGNDTFKSIADIYTKLEESLGTTDGKITTFTQKKLLGELSQENATAAVISFVGNSAMNIVNDAQTIADNLRKFGYTTPSGEKLTYTAEQLTEGYDAKDPRTIFTALKKNEALRTLAIADATSRIMLDADETAKNIAMGEALVRQADLNRLLETGDEKTIHALEEVFGIDDLRAVNADTLNAKIRRFAASGEVKNAARRYSLSRELAAIPEESAKNFIPKRIIIADGAQARYSDGSWSISVARSGNTYTLYDHGTGKLSKNLSTSEINRVMADYAKNKEAFLAERSAFIKKRAELETNAKKQAMEADTYAMENIKDYARLSAPNRSMIRKVIREARANGISEEDALSYARVSARTGLDITFSKEANAYKATDADGSTVIKHADGYLDPARNRIVINPEATRPHGSLLIHELTHAIYYKDGVLTVAKGIEKMPADKKQAIKDRYIKAGIKDSMVLADEINAHYAEETLLSKSILEKLCADKPTLKDRILSFFKGAQKGYSEDAKLTLAAKKLYRQYKKLFDSFAAKGRGSNGVDLMPVRRNAYGDEKYALKDSFERLGKYSDKEISSIESTKIHKVAHSYDDIRAFVDSSLKSNTEQRLFIGKLTQSTVEKIYNATGIDVTNKSIALSSSDMKHIFNGHGNIKSEAMHGQIAITQANIENVIETIIEPDSVERRDIKSTVGILFKKSIDNRITAVTILSEKKKALTLKSAWITKEKQSTSLTSDVQASDLTPETGQRIKTVSDNSITDPAENVNRNSENSSGRRFALSDEGYMQAVEAGDNDAVREMLDKAAKKAGYTIRAYHGTNNREEKSRWNAEKREFDTEYSRFTVFKQQYDEQNGFFFSNDQDNAGSYGGTVYDAYLRLRRPLEIDCQNQIYNAITHNGQTMDTYDWAKYARKNKYDGVIFKNIRDGAGYSEMSKASTDYVVFKSEQIKSADLVTYDDVGNVIPLSSRFKTTHNDIRFALPEDDAYSYKTLTSKDDLKVTELPLKVPMTEDGKINRNAIIARGRLNARAQKNPNNTETSTYVRVDDIDKDVLIGTKGLQHGLARSEESALAVMKIGDILRESIAVNELNGHASRKTEMSYVLLGACRDSENLYVVRSVVSKLENDVTEIDVYRLSAVKGKKTETPNSALKRGAAVTEQSSLISSESLKISIAELLEKVKNIPLANEIFSKDVAARLGITRSDGTLSKDIRFALPENGESAFDAETIEARGLPRSMGKTKQTAANNRFEKVYSRANAVSVASRISDIGFLTKSAQAEITSLIWETLNSCNTMDEKRDASRMAADAIVTKLMNGAKEANPTAMEAQNRLIQLKIGLNRVSFSESDAAEIIAAVGNERWKRIRSRWGFKKSKGGNRIPMDIFVTDISREMPGMDYLENLHPADAFVEINRIYEQAQKDAKIKWIQSYIDADADEIQYIKDSIEDTIMNAFAEEGTKSSFAKALEGKVEKWEKRAEELRHDYKNLRDGIPLRGQCADLGQKMKDLKIHRFGNATQFHSEDLKSTIGALSNINFRGDFNATGARRIIGELLEWYTNPDVRKNILGQTETEAGRYVQGVAEMMDSIAHPQNGDAFTNDDFRTIADIMRYFIHFVENYGKIERQGRMIEAKPEAKRYVEIIHENEKIKKPLISRVTMPYSELFREPMSLAKEIDMYERGFHTEMLESLQSASIEAAVNEMNAMREYDAFLRENKKYAKSLRNELIDYHGVKIPKGIYLSLYATSKRDQAWAGLLYSGFKFKSTDGKYVSLPGSVDSDTVLSKEALKQNAKAFTEQVEKNLTETDKKYIAIVEKGMEYAGRLKADRDIKRMGITNVTYGYYFPIIRADMAKNIDTFEAEMDRVTNASFNKDTVKGARQKLYIDDVDAIFRRHVHAVCQYASLSPVIEAYNTLYNLDISGNPNTPVSVATEVANTWSNGKSYFRKLIADVQGISPTPTEGKKLFSFLRGGYAKFQLGANPKVWVTQLSSLFASTSELDADCVVKGFSVNTSDVDKYCSLAALRNYEGTAALAQSVLDTRIKKVKSGIDSITDALMAPIGKMDRFVVKKLFGACQAQIAKDGGAKLGTEANKVEAGKLLEKVILGTQQNSAATERSAAMRSGDEILRAATMFSADSMKAIARVFDAAGELSVLHAKLKTATDADVRTELEGRIKNVKKAMMKSSSALVMTSIFMAVTAQLFRLLYNKDDKDENDIKTMGLDALGNLFGGLPIIRAVVSKLIDGYDVSNYSYSAINDLMKSSISLVNSFSDWAKDRSDTAARNRAIRSFAYSISQIIGVPTRNIYNVIYGLINRFSPNTGYKIDGFFYSQNYRTDFYNAIEDDDADKASFILSLMNRERTGSDANGDIYDEFISLAKSGHKVLPKSIPDAITVEDMEYTFTDGEKQAIADEYATVNETVARLIRNTGYTALNDESKAYAIKYVYNAELEKAYRTVLYGGERDANEIAQDILGTDIMAIAKALKKGTSSDTDKKGSIITGSKRKKIIGAIRQMQLSDEQKLLLLCSLGYSIQDGDIVGMDTSKAKRRLLSYILRRRDLTQEEKAELAQMCGFVVKNGRIITKNL